MYVFHYRAILLQYGSILQRYRLYVHVGVALLVILVLRYIIG